MKFTSTFGALAAGLILCLGATSCNSNSNEPDEFKLQQKITDSFVHVDGGSSTAMNYKGVSYDIIYDYVAATAEVTIKGLKLPGGQQFTPLKLSNIPFKVNSAGERVLEGSNLIAGSENVSLTPMFDSFKLVIGDRTFNNELYFPWLCIQYTVNGSYSVVSGPLSQVFQGTTVTTDSNGHSFSNETPLYVLDLNPQSMKAALTINNAKFIQAMPAQTMTFSDIPYSVSDAGIITLESTEVIIPTINKTEFKAFPISGFKATYNLTKGMDLEFVCDIDKTQLKPEMADKIQGSPFKVSATMPFINKTQNQ